MKFLTFFCSILFPFRSKSGGIEHLTDNAPVSFVSTANTENVAFTWFLSSFILKSFNQKAWLNNTENRNMRSHLFVIDKFSFTTISFFPLNSDSIFYNNNSVRPMLRHKMNNSFMPIFHNVISLRNSRYIYDMANSVNLFICFVLYIKRRTGKSKHETTRKRSIWMSSGKGPTWTIESPVLKCSFPHNEKCFCWVFVYENRQKTRQMIICRRMIIFFFLLERRSVYYHAKCYHFFLYSLDKCVVFHSFQALTHHSINIFWFRLHQNVSFSHSASFRELFWDKVMILPWRRLVNWVHSKFWVV